MYLARSHKRYCSHEPLLSYPANPLGACYQPAYVTAASTIDSTISCDPLFLSVNFFFFYGTASYLREVSAECLQLQLTWDRRFINF